jgi:membrane protein DedA with SNARE-associated domain
MPWHRFFLFNAAGAIVWSGLYSVGFYYAGSTLRRFRGSVDIAIGVAAAVLIVVFLVWTRRHAKRLEQEAEAAYPGPLDDDTGASGASAPEAA